MKTTQTTRRTVVAGIGAVPLLAAVPLAGQVLAAAPPMIDRTAFAARLHQIAFNFEQLSDRADAMIANADAVLSSQDGPCEILDMFRALAEDDGTQLSLDWLICGEGNYPNGEPHQMVTNRMPVEKEESCRRIAEKVGLLDRRERIMIVLIVKALDDGDYATARKIRDMALEDMGKPVAQI